MDQSLAVQFIEGSSQGFGHLYQARFRQGSRIQFGRQRIACDVLADQVGTTVHFADFHQVGQPGVAQTGQDRFEAQK